MHAGERGREGVGGEGRTKEISSILFPLCMQNVCARESGGEKEEGEEISPSRAFMHVHARASGRGWCGREAREREDGAERRGGEGGGGKEMVQTRGAPLYHAREEIPLTREVTRGRERESLSLHSLVVITPRGAIIKIAPTK